MPKNPFQLAVVAGQDKKYSAKDYLIKCCGMSEDEAEAKLAQINQSEG